MSFISDFEDRIAALFDTAPQGYVEPFSFKKLAKRAAKEMENETYEIDGVDTAPALYTVLVSPTDDSLMRPLYQSIIDETSDFVAAEAHKKGYVFVGQPLVRFMVDPSLKSGKFAVFAENVDGATLNRLRKEEKEFLAGGAGVGGAANRSTSAPGAAAPAAAAPGIIPLGTINADNNNLQPLSSDDLAPIEIPMTQRRSEPVEAPVAAVGKHAIRTAAPATPEPVPAVPVATALLIDRQSGRTFRVEAPSGIIGRERSQATVVLTDPNISRRHAELKFDGRYWHITDLRSTNGTLVNDVDIDECVLRSGDLITVGLTNLEFRES